VIASFYAVFHGPGGLRAIAERVHSKAGAAGRGAAGRRVRARAEAFFDTVTVPVGERQSRIMAAAVARGINLRDVGADRIGISVDETTTEADLEAVCRAFGILKPPAQVPCPRSRTR
jgi:glycine dehydrogenase